VHDCPIQSFDALFDNYKSVYTVKMNMLYQENCSNRLQAILLIKFNKLELSKTYNNNQKT